MIKPIKVLIVDDSAIVRDLIERGISRDPEIEVVAKAIDVYSARDKIIFKKPDVVTLDVQMPKMNGVEFLKRLMPQYPLPVIMVSAYTHENSIITLEALSAGAIDFVLKPSTLGIQNDLIQMMDELISKIKVAADVDVSKWRDTNYKTVAKRDISRETICKAVDKIIAIGASTGGTVAITKIVENYPENFPATVVVQHMPQGFTNLFAESLNKTTKVKVVEAKNGQNLANGTVYIAPGGSHMEIEKNNQGNPVIQIHEGRKVLGHMPSVDVLFKSIAKNFADRSIGILLTGMGKDGASGLLKMRQNGARTIAQDEQSSVVFGMPCEAYNLGAVENLVGLENIYNFIVALLE